MKRNFTHFSYAKYLLLPLILLFTSLTIAAQDNQNKNQDIRRLPVDAIEPLVPDILAKAENGDPDAQLYSAFIYIKGIGVRQSSDKAFTLYKKAAENGQPEAQFGMGWNSLIGRYGLKKDPDTALSWFLKSAKQGYVKSYPMVAQLYRGVRFPKLRDNQKAFYWYKRTAEEGTYKSKGRAEFMVGCYRYFGVATK